MDVQYKQKVRRNGVKRQMEKVYDIFKRKINALILLLQMANI